MANAPGCAYPFHKRVVPGRTDVIAAYVLRAGGWTPW